MSVWGALWAHSATHGGRGGGGRAAHDTTGSIRQPGAADGKSVQLQELQRALGALRLDDALVARVASHPNKLTAGRSAVFSVAPVALSTAVGLGPSGSMPQL